MRRGRVEEEIERLTGLLRGHETLPHSFYRLLHEHGIDPAQTVLTGFVRDQGCCLAGTLLTSDGRVIGFDIDFAGDAYGAWSEWGAIEVINEWEESRLEDQRPKQGSPLDVAMKMQRTGRI